MEFFKILWNSNTKYAFTKKTIYPQPIQRCPKCKQLIRNEKIYDFSVILSKENPRSDLLSSLYSIHIISQRAYEVLKMEGIHGWIAHPIQVHNSRGKVIDAPYYSLEYTGSMTINYGEMGLINEKCDECGMNYISNPRFTYENLQLDESSWDGSDMCCGGFCTSKVLEIIKFNQLSGFMFKPSVDAWNSLKRSEIKI